MTQPLSKIETPTDSYVTHYPQAIEGSIEQMTVFWPAEELGVEEDEADFRVKLNDGERHAVQFLQSVLTKYELMIGGEEMWGGRIAKLFPRPEIQRMCSVFSMMELNSHAPFYDLTNKTLNIATDEFYTRWKHNEILSNHIAYIEKMASSECPLETTAALTFLEGGVLFSIFALMKSMNVRGFNMMPHFVSGIDASSKDEDFHSQGSAWLFNQCRSERAEAGYHTAEDEARLQAVIHKMALDVYEHERLIMTEAFAVGGIRFATLEEILDFVQDRINLTLNRLGYAPLFIKDRGAVSKWFYSSISAWKNSDFFATTQIQYVRNWNKSKLTFRPELIHNVR